MESSQLNVLTRISQHLVRKALMLLVGLNLCTNTPVAGQCGNDFTTCRPTNASCGNPTLTLLSAALGTPGACVRCPDRGTISLPMTLTIQNTGPAQTAVAIWAVVTKTNSSGSTTCRMSRCSDMPLVANGISTVSLGNIQYSCGDGDQLTLTNIILTSTATGTCADLQGCNTPCSRTAGPIVVTLPRFMAATLTATTPSCLGVPHGSITVAATGGTSYTFTIMPGGTTNTTGSFTGLSAGTYRVVVVDDAGCRDVVSDIVVAPKSLTISCPPTDGGPFTCEGDVPAPNHGLIGLSGSAQGCNITITSTDGRNNGTGCANNPLIIRRTYTISYGGVITNCVQTFTVIDNVPPVVTAGPISSCYPTAALAEAAAIAATTATDNCGTPIKTATTIGDCSAVITVTATDACGNSASVTYQTRIDNTAPTAGNTDLGLLACNELLPTNTGSFITATDNCPGHVTILAPTVWSASGAADNNCIVTYTRSYTITDGCNNSAIVIQTVQRKEDLVPPTAGNTDLGNLGCNVTLPTGNGITATDNCGTVTISEPSAWTASGAAENCVVTYTRTFTMTDECGNTASATQTAQRKEDLVPPTAGNTDLGNLGCNVTLPTGNGITATDNCGTVTISEPSAWTASGAANNCVVTYTRTFTMTDECGNTASATQTAQRKEDLVPLTAGNTNLGMLACNAALPTGNGITATDNCPGAITISSPTAWAVSGLGGNNCVVIYTRTFRMRDECGNTASATQTVSRTEDRVDPVFQTADLIKNLTCAQYQALAGNYTSLQPQVTDNCPGTITLTPRVNANAATTICNRRSFTINWLAVDACGNRATGVQTVHINTPTLAVTATVNCLTRGGTITINAAGGCGPYSYVVTCSTGGSTVTTSNNVLTNVANGRYTVVVTDANGCTASQDVRVNCPEFCTMTQAQLGNNANPDCPAVGALMSTPITIGSGSRTLTLNTKECVVSLLPSTGTAAALSASYTCSSCGSCTNCECSNCGFPSNLTITDNRLVGHTLALALSLRKPENTNFGALLLSEICGLDIPTIPNVSGTTTISGLLGILNQALGGNPTYTSSLNRLARLTQDITVAYHNCANPCATNPCTIPAARDLSAAAPAQPNIVKENLDFKVYPVPSSGTVQVALEEDLTQDITITVYTLTSQVVQIQDVTALNQKSVTLELGHLPDGTYLISVRGASQKPVSKVLIINK